MRVNNSFEINLDYVVLGLVIFSVITLILLIILFVKNSKLNKRYLKFMKGSNGESLEDSIQTRFSEIDNIKEILSEHNGKFSDINDVLKATYQKIGIIKYDAFKEAGGKLSFVLAMLNQQNNGFIMNSVHSSREGCYTYIKEIINGESFVVLSEEEQEALDKALNCDNLV